MGVLDPIVQALSSPGPVNDRSTHTTTQLPATPQPSGPGTGAIHTNQTKPSKDDGFALLKAGKGGPKPY